ncbi:MAG: hypothetical protein EOS50_26070 [Mesorhizobium sp.]|nr:MAG: hypothetical protein EOS50_26070 [Mesorhizobium sp.]
MARRPIVQRIALEGGDAIKDQLKALGDAGEKAFNQIKNAAVKADLDKFGASLSKVGSDLATVGRRLALLGTGLAAAAGGATVAVVGLAKSGAEAADAAGKAAQKTGLQIDAYGRLEFAAKQADVSQEEFVSGMSRLNKAIAEAATETSKAGDVLDATGVKVTRFGGKTKDAAKKVDTAGNVFTKLGVKIKDANGRLRSNEAIVQDVAAAFARMPDGALKSALAIELFGKAGANLLPFLNQGADGLRALGTEAEKLGILFTPEQFAVGDALGDSLDSLSTAIKAIRVQFGLLFAPIVLEAAKGLTDIVVANKDAILQLGAAAARTVAGILGDLLHLLSGNDQNVKNPWILHWRDAIVGFGRDVQAVVNTVVLPLFKAVRDAANLVADSLNAMFGTNVTGGQLLIGAALLQLLGVFRLITSSVGVVVAGLRLIGTALATMFSGGLIASAKAFFGTIVTGAKTFLGLVAGLVGWPALLVAALVAAGVAVFVFWDDIVAGAQGAIAKIREFFSAENLAKVFAALLEGAKQAGALFVELWRLQVESVGFILKGLATIVSGFVQGVISEIGNLAGQLLPSWDQIKAAGTEVWNSIKSAATGIWEEVVAVAMGVGARLQPAWEAIKSGASDAWNFIRDNASVLWDGVVDIFTSAKDRVFSAVSAVASAAFEAWTGASADVVDAANQIVDGIERATSAAGDVSGAEKLAQALVAPFQQAQQQINEIMSAIRGLVQNGFLTLASSVNSIANQIETAINRILSALRKAAAEAQRLRAAAGSSSSSGGGTQGFAGGGAVRGAGGPKTDSILAWLSNGEFVIQAAAMKKLGVGFLNALNNGFLPSLKGLRGFSLGGLADGFNRSMAIPRFADGGFAKMKLAPASAGKTVHVKLQYGVTEDQVIDMIGEESAVDKLYRFAIGESLTSAGRSPRRT